MWIIIWVFTVTSVPNNHPCMSRVEKDYIIDAIGPTIVSEETEDVCVTVLGYPPLPAWSLSDGCQARQGLDTNVTTFHNWLSVLQMAAPGAAI